MSDEQQTDTLVLGPMMRYVDTDSATVWVETSRACEVVVEAGPVRASARTFGAHGHHYALVEVEGLEPGSRVPYTVSVDGEQVWPEAGSPYPEPVIATIQAGKPLRMAYGSCRTSVSHDQAGNDLHGVDALRSYSMRMAGVTGEADFRWPDLVVFLGDQVYADETTDAMREFIAARRDIEQAPWTELADYEEYAHLYWLAWSDPANRWLLSTLPSSMIFDDHDVRDDWNTSYAWRQQMEATSWWHGRIVAGLGSYWVYQHLGNLSKAERAADPLWQRVTSHAAFADASEELDLTEALDAFADRADAEPSSYRWSYVREFGDQARLVVIDTRAGRVLEPDHRAMLDDEEMTWLSEQLRGDVDHLFVGSSLPFLLAPGLHYVEAFGEALAGGAWGSRLGRLGEKLRQGVDLEHWAAFQESFQAVTDMVMEVATGRRGRAPRTVTFLSGDVHHSFVSEARVRPRTGLPPLKSRLLQAVCSPIRNPLPRRMRFATAVLSYGVAGPIGHVVARSAKVPDAPLTWSLLRGPWFDNNLASLEVTDDGLALWWVRGTVTDGDHDAPALETVASIEVVAPRH
ncbi:alkaline phosphatase D family protein [Nocardioides lentus]|uniref:Alkaline phosphatase D family protein n=1 Tax=Nocardioides lentus TaxID=338077 RepID=A0ABN2P259_9ACTN